MWSFQTYVLDPFRHGLKTHVWPILFLKLIFGQLHISVNRIFLPIKYISHWVSVEINRKFASGWEPYYDRFIWEYMSKKSILHVQFPRNSPKFGITLNDFCSSTIWAIPIQVSLTEFKHPRIPGIPPNYRTKWSPTNVILRWVNPQILD